MFHAAQLRQAKKKPLGLSSAADSHLQRQITNMFHRQRSSAVARTFITDVH